jgi:F420H(2)-dependent quinone reductase
LTGLRRSCYVYGVVYTVDIRRREEGNPVTEETLEKPTMNIPRWVVRTIWVLHRAVYRLTRGRIGLRETTDTRWGMMRLRTVGRRTGKERIAILGYIADGPNLVTLAMNGWADPEPAWWLNLQARPDATVELPDGPREVTGRAATADEQARLWAALVAHGSAVGRDASDTPRAGETAIVVLEPRSEGADRG